MQPRTIPTSPKNNLPVKEDLAKVWPVGQIQPPPKYPWGRIWTLVIIVGIVLNIGFIYGLGWYVHHWPQAWLIRWLPLSTTTQVVQPVKEKEVAGVPTAVADWLAGSFGLAVNQGAKGVYTDASITGLAWPLSANGWLLTIAGAIPNGATSPAVIPAAGPSMPTIKSVLDSASPFVFIKVNNIDRQPISFNNDITSYLNQPIWIVTNQAVVTRQIVSSTGPHWSSSDRLEQSWQLDSPANVPIGSAVVDKDGHVIGLIGQDSRVWAIGSLTDVIKQVVQQGTIVRPQLGLRTIQLSAATSYLTNYSNGALIGADEGQAAVIAKGPADRAGVMAGDIITKIDNQPLVGELYNLLQRYQPDDQISLEIIRQTKTQTVTVELGAISS